MTSLHATTTTSQPRPTPFRAAQGYKKNLHTEADFFSETWGIRERRGRGRSPARQHSERLYVPLCEYTALVSLLLGHANVRNARRRVSANRELITKAWQGRLAPYAVADHLRLLEPSPLERMAAAGEKARKPRTQVKAIEPTEALLLRIDEGWRELQFARAQRSRNSWNSTVPRMTRPVTAVLIEGGYLQLAEYAGLVASLAAATRRSAPGAFDAKRTLISDSWEKGIPPLALAEWFQQVTLVDRAYIRTIPRTLDADAGWFKKDTTWTEAYRPRQTIALETESSSTPTRPSETKGPRRCPGPNG